MTTRVLLLDIGAGDLPAVTPTDAALASWMPVVYQAPAIPVPANLTVVAVADGVAITWDAVAGAEIYVIERAPDIDGVPGAWVEVARTTSRRYTYTDGTGGLAYYRVRAEKRGQQSAPTVPQADAPVKVGVIIGDLQEEVEANTAELIAQQAALDNEREERLAGELAGAAASAADATAKANAARLAAIAHADVIGAQVADIIGADVWVTGKAYPSGDLVRYGTGLYRALRDNTSKQPDTNPLDWQYLGQYQSLGEAVAGSISMGHANASDIAAEAAQLDAVQARMPAGAGVLATGAALSSLDGRVTTAEGTIAAQGTAITAANAAIATKASASAVSTLEGRVSAAEGVNTTQGTAITSVTAALGGGANLVQNAAFHNGISTVVMRQNPGGQAIAWLGLNLGVEYQVPNENTVYVHEAGIGSGTTYPFAEWYIGEAIPVKPGQRYDGYAYVIGHRARTEIYMAFMNASNTDLAFPSSGQIAPAGGLGNALGNYVQAGAFGVAPAGATKVRLVLRKYNTNAGEANSYVFMTRPFLGEVGAAQTTHTPWSPDSNNKIDAAAITMLDGRVTSTEAGVVANTSAITAANTAITGKASTGAVAALQSQVDTQGGQIVANASAITGVSTTVGGHTSAISALTTGQAGGGNLLTNASMSNDLSGYAVIWNSDDFTGVIFSRNLAAPDWKPLGVNTFGLSVAGNPAGGHLVVGTRRYPCEPGKNYIASVYCAAHRCNAGMSLRFSNEALSFLSEPSSVGPVDGGGKDLSGWTRRSVVGTAPAGAVWVEVLFWQSFNSGGHSPYAWYCQPQLEQTKDGQTQPSPWSAGGREMFAAHTVVLDVNGNISGTRSENDGTSSMFSVLANVWRVISSGTSGLEWRDGYLRAYSGAIQLLLGINFGASSNLCFWYGPNVGAAACTKANGTIWFDNTGGAYFGGTLSAGTLKNAVQTTTTVTTGTELINGPFTTNGNARTVTISFSRTHNRSRNASGGTGFAAGAGTNTATVQIYRKIGTAAESLWQTINVTGALIIENEFDGPDNALSTWGGALTVNDTSSAASTVQYRVLISAFTEQAVTHTAGAFDSQSITQSLSIISVEQ